MRPMAGPASIAPGGAPGGVVVHVYGLPSGALLTVSAITTAHDAQAIGEADGDRAIELADPGDDALYLVAYDGDTGERMATWPWRSSSASR